MNAPVTVDMFVAQGTPVLERHFGIWPEYVEAALGSLCGAYERVFGHAPRDWFVIEAEIDHPDLQATIAYYRALGPYERRTGRYVLEPEEMPTPGPTPEAVPEPVPSHCLPLPQPEPVKVRGLTPIKNQGRIAPVVVGDPAVRDVSARPDYSTEAYSRIEGLGGCPPERRRMLLRALLEAAPPDRFPVESTDELKAIEDAIWEIAEEARQQGCRMVDVHLPHSNPCPMAGLLVMTWMDMVRPSFYGVRLWFKFSGKVDSPGYWKR